jgi:RNA polymerase sigma-B factor
MAEMTTEELLLQYKKTGDIALRNKIAEKYLYIAEILAKKFVGRGVEYDDLYQVASLALLRGIEKFDPEQGVKFTTFITPTITGKIKNYFRDRSRTVKLPRRLGEQNAAVRAFCAKFETEKGSKPSVKEIADGLSMAEEDVVRALEVSGTVSLDRMAASEDEDNKSLHDLIPNAKDEYEDFEMRETLRAAMKDFTDVEKNVVKYRYVDQLSQSETANRLGVSQMFVSRMERKILVKLRDRLKDSV